jgi:uncharacterized protein (TIGR02996 family)
MHEREAFLDYIASRPWDDHAARAVYADWLDERGEHEEADRQRKYVPAKAWLRAFCGIEDDDAEAYYIGVNTLIREAGKALEDGSLIVDCGANEDMCDNLRRDCREFWHNVSVVTGLPLPEGHAEKSRFGCSC